MTNIRKPSWTSAEEKRYVELVGSHVVDPLRRLCYERSIDSNTITADWLFVFQKVRANCCFHIRCLEAANKPDLRSLSRAVDEMHRRIDKHLHGTNFIRFDRSVFCGFIVAENSDLLISYRAWVPEYKRRKYIQALRDIVSHYLPRGVVVGHVCTREGVQNVLERSSIWQVAHAGMANIYFHTREFER